MSAEPLIARAGAWAESRPDIRALVVVGSWARADHPADPWSDLDLWIFAVDPERYLADLGWVAALGEVSIAFLERHPGHPLEVFALFAEGRTFNGMFSAHADLPHLVETRADWGLLRRGARVLVDKDGLAAGLVVPTGAAALPGQPPPLDEFQTVVSAFWYSVFYVARQLRRGELWRVKVRDQELKQRLLWMLECHARATHGWDYDTWFQGRFLPEWADPGALAALDATFGHFNAADSWRALFATMDLFRRLATETATHLGYAYPAAADAHVTALVTALHAERQPG
jgi:aminoglycoside 6-adenylyltransferase